MPMWIEGHETRCQASRAVRVRIDPRCTNTATQWVEDDAGRWHVCGTHALQLSRRPRPHPVMWSDGLSADPQEAK